MQIKTEGIVLSNVRYNDKYSLVHLYTRQAGRVVYMVHRPKGKSSKMATSMFSPMNILSIDAEHLPNRDIHRIKEARILLPLQSIPQDMGKTAIVFFLSEFLSKVLKDGNDCSLIYDFVSESVKVLEISERGISNFHIVFLLKLIGLLGFSPNLENYHSGCRFDLMAGEFISHIPTHKHFISPEESIVLARLARIHYGNMHHFAFNRGDRNIIIRHILNFYRLHVQNFSELKSPDILSELF